jgi:hypothetical protein
MQNLWSRLFSFWHERGSRPPVGTYEASLEELGGVPWRALPECTDRWFINSTGETGKLAAILDTGALKITNSWVTPKSVLLLLVIGLLVGGTALGGYLSSPPAPAAVAAPSPAAAPGAVRSAVGAPGITAPSPGVAPNPAAAPSPVAAGSRVAAPRAVAAPVAVAAQHAVAVPSRGSAPASLSLPVPAPAALASRPLASRTVKKHASRRHPR